MKPLTMPEDRAPRRDRLRLDPGDAITVYAPLIGLAATLHTETLIRQRPHEAVDVVYRRAESDGATFLHRYHYWQAGTDAPIPPEDLSSAQVVRHAPDDVVAPGVVLDVRGRSRDAPCILGCCDEETIYPGETDCRLWEPPEEATCPAGVPDCAGAGRDFCTLCSGTGQHLRECSAPETGAYCHHCGEGESGFFGAGGGIPCHAS